MVSNSGRATSPYLTPPILLSRPMHPCLAGGPLQHAGPLHQQAGGVTRAATSTSWSYLPCGRCAEHLAITSMGEQSNSDLTM